MTIVLPALSSSKIPWLIVLQNVIKTCPSMELFRALPVINPAKVDGVRKSLQEYIQVTPALTPVSAEEWHCYIHLDRRDAEVVHSVEWWTAREDRMAMLAPIAALYLHLLTTSVDAEILFSNYTMLLTQYRWSLTG